MNNIKKLSLFLICSLTVFFACNKSKSHRFVSDNRFAPFAPSKDLEADFKQPPEHSKPWAFWWWLEGNIDSEGIRKDLVAMKDVGIAGALIYDAGSSSYTDVYRTSPGPDFMGEKWQALFSYTAKVADSLHLKISLNIGSGWNDGGPWVTPEYASKKLAWSSTEVTGPKLIDQQLPLPKDVFVWDKNNKAYFSPVAVLAVKLAHPDKKIAPLKYFNLKAVQTEGGPRNQNGYDWSIYLDEDTATLNDYDAQLKDVINISNKVDSSGHINWQAPAGDYKILRFGYTGTGAQVSTSSPGGSGLAIDYMDTSAMDLQFNNMAGKLINNIKSLSGKSLMYLHDDSWELGAANWTPAFIKEFKQRRGYDPVPYLPVIAGEIIGSKDISNRFLYDFRRTIADLIAQNHYQRLKTLAHQHHLGIHPESGGPHPAPIDALMNLGIDDIPMGEFWAKVNTHRVQDYERIFVKQSASAAHIYGHRYVQAEGPTSIGPQWEMDPEHLKPTIDRAFCEGLNRMVFHTFTHSPDSVGKPGNEYFAGTHFNPNITWWKQAPAYTKYIARCQTMLQQGAFVADVCYYYGDNVPNQVHLKRIDPSLGEGYDYDFVDTRILLDSMYVKHHQIYLKDGMHYQVLVLPHHKAMPLKVLEKLEQLVKAGATVIGDKPLTTAGLGNYKDNNLFNKLADRLWQTNGKEKADNDYGDGKVVWGKTIRQTLLDKGIGPDFVANGEKQLKDIDYIHRRFGDYDIYFVSNWRDSSIWTQANFRINNKAPQLWYPDNGEIIPQRVYSSNQNTTSLPLYLPPHGAVFVVFKEKENDHHIDSMTLNNQPIYPITKSSDSSPLIFCPADNNHLLADQAGAYWFHYADGNTKKVDITSPPKPVNINGPWKVNFDTAWGGPAETTFPELISWPESHIKGIKYYSGTALYSNHFNINDSQLDKSFRLILKLDTVYNIAEVQVNGHELGVLWKKPFSVDVTPYVKAGDNQLLIKVVNLWPNRIIGDQSLSPDKRYTHTNVTKFTKDYPLRPSGLLGPVSIQFKPWINIE